MTSSRGNFSPTEASHCLEAIWHTVAVDFDEVYERFRRPVWRLSRRFTESEEEALDTTQEVFLRVWRGLPGFRGESKLSTWVFQIAWNHLRAHRRKMGRRPFTPNGRLLAYPRTDDTLAFHDLPVVVRVDSATGHVLEELSPALGNDDFAEPLAYSPDGRFLAAQVVSRSEVDTSVRSRLVVWDLTTAGESRMLWEGDGDDFCTGSPAFFPDGRTLVTVWGKRIALWEVAGDQSHNHVRRRIQTYIPSGRMIIVASTNPKASLPVQASSGTTG